MSEDSVKLFISYSHRDEALRRQLDKHLAPLKKQNVIAAWNDREIKAGMNWANEIDHNLNRADIILLLISPDFVASDYCSNIELEQAMKRHHAGDAIIVPVVLEPCDWAWLPFGKFQAFPRDAKAVTTWVNQNEAFLDVVAGIRKVAQELFEQRQQKLKQRKLDRDEYKAKVEEALSLSTSGNISVADRDTLDELREKLELTKQEAEEIEAHAYKPFKDREEKLEKYKGTLLKYIELGYYPFPDDVKRQLEIRQRDLGIKTEDIEKISQPILIEAEAKYQEKLQSEAARRQRQLEELESQQQSEKVEILPLTSSENNAPLNSLNSSPDRTDSATANPSQRVIPAQDITSQRVSGNYRTSQTKQEARSETTEQFFFPEKQIQTVQNLSRKPTSQFFSALPKRTLVFLLLAIISFLLVIGIWLLTKSFTSPTTGNSTGYPDSSIQEQQLSTQDRVSFGNKILIKESGNPENPDFEAAKAKGAAAMENGDYQQAEAAFAEALQEFPNAPETLIYLNNARIGSKKSYTIAVSVPITGPNPNFASEMLRGFAQAQDEINQAGGIDGVGLKLKIFDDRDDKELAKQIASAIVQDSEILAVMGHWSSPISLAAAPIYDNGKIPFITPISTTIKLSNFGPYIFRTNANTSKGAKALSNYALNQLKIKDIAIFYDSNSPSYSQELESQFSDDIQQAGGTITNRFDLSDPALSIADSISEALRKDAKLLVLMPSPTSINQALQVVTTNGRRLPVLGDMANLYARKTLEVGGEDAVGMVLAPSWHVDADPNSAFSRSSRSLWKSDVNSATATSYNAAQALIEALRREENPSRSGIQSTFMEPNFSANGATGEFHFLESGDTSTSIQLVEIRPANPSRSGTGFDFVPIR